MRPVHKPPPSTLVADLLNPAQQKHDSLTLLRLQLQATIGGYCSFCEIPINVTQAVVSKLVRNLTRMPTLKDWNNLLLACDFCQLHRTLEVPNPSDYLWPDTDATFSLGTTSPFLYALKNVKYVVKRDSGESESSAKSLVIVSANPRSNVFEKAARTIDLFQLNTPFYDANNYTFTISEGELQARIDPRVELRTEAWSAAARSIAMLRRVKTRAASPVSFDTAIQMTCALAQVSGFWSGWMTSLWQAFSDMDLVKRALIEVTDTEEYMVTGFQTLPDGGSPPWKLFTGTAVDRLTF